MANKKGSANTWAKLNEIEVMLIKSLIMRRVPNRQIAKGFKTSEDNISSIKIGRRWGHLQLDL